MIIAGHFPVWFASLPTIDATLMRNIAVQSRRFRCVLPALALVSALAGCAGQAVQEETVKTRLPIAQTERGVMIWLPEQVQFDVGKSEFDQLQAQTHLDVLARILREKTSKSVMIEGHTDNAGTAEFNLQLSSRRAETVRTALLKRGVAKERLKVSSFGWSRPIAPNDTEVGRALNRRVELIVLDETVENLSRGEPANSFEAAFEKLQEMFSQPIPRAR